MAHSILTSLVFLSLLSTTLSIPPTTLTTLCKSTPYPNQCYTSMKPLISINISPNIITYLLQALQFALSEAHNLSNLLSNAGPGNLAEAQLGAVQDCRDLHEITLLSLQRSSSIMGSYDANKYLADTRVLLSAALTNKVTCLEGLESASGPMKPMILDSMTSTYNHVSNCLSFLSNSRPSSDPMKKNKKVRGVKNGRKLMGFPKWLSAKDHRKLDDYDESDGIVVAQDGSGHYTTISDAISFAPNNSDDRVIIYVKSGIYEENVEIPYYKTNIVLLGDGTDVTVITGNRSVVDGWTTFRSATVAVSGSGFLARDITFMNTAGPEKHQAVALRINADYAAIYRCIIDGYQDTLYAHSFRQFYRECDIYGTIDYICGNAGAVFQACNIITKRPMPGQSTVITAQSSDNPDESTGFSIQNCSIITTDDFDNYSNGSSVSKVKSHVARPRRAYFRTSHTVQNSMNEGRVGKIKNYLGRPWRAYSRSVFIESYIDDFINPLGWLEWSPNEKGKLETLYYGEYQNYGPGSNTTGRVSWTGYHIMDYEDASYFTVSELISGEEWLDSTSFPYDDGV